MIWEKMISTFVDELIKLITEINLFVMSAVKYLMSYSFLNTILAKGSGTGSLRYLEMNPFSVNSQCISHGYEINPCL